MGRSLILFSLVAAAILGLPRQATCQQTNPVYVDDSAAATDTLARLPQLVASGNESEAVRALQQLLEQEPDRLIATEEDAELFESVRGRVHRELLSSPRLLQRYRQSYEPAARALLDSGDLRRAETVYLLTSSGFEAALRLAQEAMEAAHFNAALLILEQLEEHPDRRAGADAAAMLGQVARYAARPDATERAARWAAEAGDAGPIPQPIARPPGARSEVRSPSAGVATAPPAALPVGRIPERPLWSAPLDPEAPAEPPIPPVANTARPTTGAASLRGPRLLVYPTVTGDLVLANDGATIRAWDRYTLEPRWAVRPSASRFDPQAAAEATAENRAMRRAAYEDTNTVSVAGGLALTATGIAAEGRRYGDERLHAIELGTGRVLWSVMPVRADRTLASASFRGPALGGEGVVVVQARNAALPRRIVSSYALGLDLATGAHRWTRVLGSAGSLPGQTDRRVADTGVMERGVAYLSDQLGVIAAVEADTGRPIWTRRVPTFDVQFAQMATGAAWESNTPLLHGEWLFIVASDGREILQLDRRTGAVIASRPANIFAEPRYVVKTGEYLVAVGREQAGIVRLDRFADSAVRLSGRYGDGGARGRAVPVEGGVLVPTTTGAVLIEPERAQAPITLQLERPGTLVPMPDGLLAADDRFVHSYLGWEIADRLLTERMAAEPNDPRHAVSYADLAYRAGQPEKIAAAADRALAAIDRDPRAAVNAAARERLFESLREMVDRTQAAWRAPEPPGDVKLPSIATLDQIVARLGRAAASREERLAWLLALGRLREGQGRPGDAVEAYQNILADRGLAGAPWATAAGSTRGEIEATRRLRDLLLEHGHLVYAAYEAEAEAQLALLGAAATGEALEDLARRYPVSLAAPRLWMLAAEARERTGRTALALAALGAALQAAETGIATAAPPPPQGAPGAAGDLGEAAGRLITALAEAEQPSSAAQMLSRMRARYPDLRLTNRGVTIDVAALSEQLAGRLAGADRFPRIGRSVVGEPQLISGWMPMRERDPGRARLTEGVMLVSDVGSEVAYFGIDPAGAAADPAPAGPGAEPGHLRLLWSRRFTEQPPALLRAEPEAVYLLWPGPQGASIERIDTIGGGTRWKTPPIMELLPGDPADPPAAAGLQAGRFETPLGHPTSLAEAMILLDERTIVIIQRSGRGVILNSETGRPRGTFASPVRAVYVADAAEGYIVIAGGASVPRPGGDDAPPVMAVYDSATGRLIRRIDDLAGAVRWVRMAPNGLAVLGTRSEIVARELATGNEAWAVTGGGAVDTRDAWVFGDALFTLNSERRLYAASVATGAMHDEPAATGDFLDSLARLDAAALGDRVAFTNSSGVLLLTHAGGVVGRDALGAEEDLLPAATSERYFVTIQLRPRDAENGRVAYRMHLLTTESASLAATHDLALSVEPGRIAILDGRVIVASGGGSIVYPMPPEGR